MPLHELVFSSLIAPLMLTLLFEGLYFIKRKYDGVSFWTAFILLNLITNLSLNLVLGTLTSSPEGYFPVFIVGEILVVVVEALGYLYYLPDRRDIFVHTAQANMSSMLLGVVVSIITLLT